jgi:hypothetical protein
MTPPHKNKLHCSKRHASMHLFTNPPASVNESYVTHACAALRISVIMLAGAAAAGIHAFFPFLFTTTASSLARSVYKSIKTRREAS